MGVEENERDVLGDTDLVEVELAETERLAVAVRDVLADLEELGLTVRDTETNLVDVAVLLRVALSDAATDVVADELGATHV